ncbi:MAG: hypothetical protein Q8Q04_03375 [archaeon]|nr:hypothetical protein [archaeon]
MRKISLKKLVLNIKIPENVFYQDDGEVDSISSHYANLLQRYLSGTNFYEKMNYKFKFLYRELMDKIKGIEHNGKFFMINLYGRSYIHTFIKKGLSPALSTMIGAHEETHVLIHLNKIDYLKRDMKKNRIDQKEFDSLSEEVKSCVGGWYALIVKNKFNGSIKGINLSPKEDELKAFEWIKEHSNYKINITKGPYKK